VEGLIKLDKKTIDKFIKRMLEDMEGEWILVGGSLMLALGLSDRITIDIDIVPIGESTNKETLELMEISQSLGMPPETVNLSAEFFLKKIRDWEKGLILFKKSDKCTIYRPGLELFETMKRGRGSEVDMQDIELYKKLKK